MWCPCIGHAVRTWSAVCSEAPHSQFGEGARPHLCMEKWNRPTLVRRRLNLTQAARGKPIPTNLTPVPGTKKHGAWKHFHSTPRSICGLFIQRCGCQVWQGCPKDSGQLVQTGVWILVSLDGYLRTHLKNHTRYDRGPEIHAIYGHLTSNNNNNSYLNVHTFWIDLSFQIKHQCLANRHLGTERHTAENIAKTIQNILCESMFPK